MTADSTLGSVADWRHFDSLELPPILEASLNAFVEHGYHGTTVRDIARRVGLSVPGIYYHYRNKQALLATLLESGMADVLTRCRAAVAQAGPAPVARLTALVEATVLFMAHRRDPASLAPEMRHLEPANRARYVAMRDDLELLVVDAVSDGVGERVFTTAYPDDSSRAVLTMCQGVAIWYRLDGPVSPEDLARRYVHFALGLVGFAGPPPVPCAP